MEPIRVLIIEDDPDGGLSVKEAIEDAGYEAVLATTGKAGIRLFGQSAFDVVLADLALPDINGIEVLEKIRQQAPTAPVIIMTAHGSIASSVKALKAGAYDYMTKPLDLDDVQAKVKRAAETLTLRRQVTDLKKTVHDRYAADALIAESPAMKELIRQVKILAETNATVLITGESGSGKELIARALHVESRRSEQPFIAVNCGAFSETLLESELFGHEKGAFTGAAHQHPGAFERAHGGTLFLDEIGDAPPAVQVKLLRVLEEKELIRLGGAKLIRVDVRLVSATNKDLDEMIEQGTFREDLLYRLKVVNLQIPPLRHRKEEIRPLADYIIARACAEHGRVIQRVDPSFYERLQACDWPGNVRQLRNVVEAAVIMAVRPILDATSIQLPDAPRAETAPGSLVVPEGMTFEKLEREILAQSLRRYEGNRSLTAEKLGLSRRTIQRKIQDYDLPF